MPADFSSTTRIGVLLVHGIGEQAQFQHLEAVVRNLVSALQEQEHDPINDPQVTVTVRTSSDSAYGALQKVWLSENSTPVSVTIKQSPTQQVQIDFQEVWWADLDEPTTWKTQLQFWRWGLSLWSNPGYLVKQPKDAVVGDEYQPALYAEQERPQIQPKHRLALFAVALVLALTQPVLSLISLLLQQLLGAQVQPDILVQYMGDVKLYQQKYRATKGPLVDLGRRPRRTIKRRLIKAMVKMALADYDRWYVLAHSLGTIVAFNGLTEDELLLSQFLEPDLLAQWEAKCGSADICRRDLFSKLRGLLTYGSPLSKFAVLWPAIVPLNQDERVFAPDFEWINVYDPADPVSAKTKYFYPKDQREALDQPHVTLRPVDIAYKADKLHLLSHLHYLTFKPHQPDRLIHTLNQWLLTGNRFTKLQPTSKRWLTKPQVTRQVIWQQIIWLLAAIILPLVLSGLIALVLWGIFGITPTLAMILRDAGWYIVAAIATVIVAGLFRD